VRVPRPGASSRAIRRRDVMANLADEGRPPSTDIGIFARSAFLANGRLYAGTVRGAQLSRPAYTGSSPADNGYL